MSVSVIVMGANGRMGKTIAQMVLESADHELGAVVERSGHTDGLSVWQCMVSDDLNDLLPQVPEGVIIDFTAPEVSLANARIAAAHGNPIVIGTTGFSEEEKTELASLAEKIPVLWAPNMSVGINTLLKILPMLVQSLGAKYDLEMVELHHNKKKDSPSGTALILAECLAEARNWVLSDVANYHREGIIGERPQEEIGVQTVRGGDVVGVHTVYCMGPGERIEVTHQAHSRENFAAGALRAALWLSHKNAGKLYAMTDVLSCASV